MQKTKNSKIGLCTFLPLPKTNPLKKNLRKSVSRLRNKSRTYGRTDGRDRNHRSRNKFRGPKINSWDQKEPENGQKSPIVFVFQEKTALFSVQCISKSIFKDFVHLLILCAKCAQKQVFLLIFRVKIRRYGLGPKTKNVRHVEKNKI